jgi:hypothetical protein
MPLQQIKETKNERETSLTGDITPGNDLSPGKKLGP